jgi:hypothetical protein
MENRYHCVVCRTKRFEHRLDKVFGRYVCKIENVINGRYVKSVSLSLYNENVYVSECANEILKMKKEEVFKRIKEYDGIKMDLIKIGRKV